MSNCSHQYTREWYSTTDHFGDETEGHWERETVRTTVDIDTHRYQCTQCGLIMFYSGWAARTLGKG